MQKDNPLFDDLSRLASGAAGAMMDMRREMEQMAAEQVRRMAERLELVTREEFEVVRDLAEKARLENEALKVRIEALEAQEAEKQATKKPTRKD